MHRVPEIKLIRTDTTLDLSQKAEKVCLTLAAVGLLQPRSPYLLLWDGNFETQRWANAQNRAYKLENFGKFPTISPLGGVRLVH